LFLFLFSSVLIQGTNFLLGLDDIRIESYPGNLKMTNSNGGFFIDRVDGNCELEANSGSINLGYVKGNLIATTSAGDIKVNETEGEVRVKTQAGNVFIEKSHKHVYAETQLGEIVIRNAKSVEARNIFGGDVKLYNISEYSKVTTSGNILLVIDKEASLFNICDLSSTQGDITIYLPQDISTDIEIRTPITEDPKRETRIESDFSFINFDQKCIEEGKILLLTTSINKGKGKIRIYIETGDIYLKMQKQK
jgi:DUF4097 and DUF4098 domain-containing protein YvlB